MKKNTVEHALACNADEVFDKLNISLDIEDLL